jgi:predicted ATPase
MIDGTDLNIKDECEKLRNRIPFIAGDTGTCKTTLACTIARHCKYNPVVINLSSVKSVEELISIIKSETLTHNVNSMFSTIESKGEFDI